MNDLQLYEWKNICLEMSKLGAASLAKMLAPAKDNMSQREAYRTFGEARVKNWVRRGMLKVIRNGETENSKKLYSYEEMIGIETAEKMYNINSKKI